MYILFWPYTNTKKFIVENLVFALNNENSIHLYKSTVGIEVHLNSFLLVYMSFADNSCKQFGHLTRI